MRRIRILLIASESIRTQTLYTILAEAKYQLLYLARTVTEDEYQLVYDTFRPDLVLTDSLDEFSIDVLVHYFSARDVPSLHIVSQLRHIDVCRYLFKPFLEQTQFVLFPDYHADLIDYVETMIFDTRQDVEHVNRIYRNSDHEAQS